METTATRHAARGRASKSNLWTLFASASALVLCTVTIVLWWPIDQAFLARADDAGWDTSLLLPNQFFITIVLLGTWLCIAAAVTSAAMSLRADQR